jgi:hypothetical protein
MGYHSAVYLVDHDITKSLLFLVIQRISAHYRSGIRCVVFFGGCGLFGMQLIIVPLLKTIEFVCQGTSRPKVPKCQSISDGTFGTWEDSIGSLIGSLDHMIRSNTNRRIDPCYFYKKYQSVQVTE